MLFAYAISTVIFDFIVWALPLPTIYGTSLPLSQRLALIALFSVGLCVVIAAAVRIHYLNIVLRETYDVTWEGTHLWMWVAVEANLGIICGCVPWLKSLVKSWRKRGDTSLTGGTGNTPGRARADGGQTIGSKGAAFRMESLPGAQGPAGVREKGAYMDLESSYTPSEHGTR